jgi:peptide/nickel transport system substrate-binding protein
VNDSKNLNSNNFRQNSNEEFHLKSGDKILSLIHRFSATEKVVFGVLILIALISSISLAWRVNSYFTVPVPSYGGSFSEGVIGLPRSVNPVLAFTDVDKDLTQLIYSGLMKYENGELVPDLAEKYTVSDDGLTYSFTLRDNLRFHDGNPLTAEDVEYTIQKIQDSTLKSPKRVDWASVSIKVKSEREIEFDLKQPYSPFLSNTTIGILPKHIWKNFDTDQFIFSQYNLEPIGSGPYIINSIQKDKEGIPTSYSLKPFSKYVTGKPHISSITIYFYPNEAIALDAYKTGAIENFAGISANEVEENVNPNGSKVLRTPLPRIFGVFFNQNNAPVLTNTNVREALNISIDRERIINEALNGYGVSISSPIPFYKKTNASSSDTLIFDKERAKAILAKDGWVINGNGVLEKKTSTGSQVLEFSIATTDAPDLKKAAEIIKKDWDDIGAKVDIKVYEYGDLSQNIIKTRKYDALLFGEIIGKDLDLYAFWHSSQRNYPGLNVSMYVNSKVDKILDDIRSTSDKEKKEELYGSFEKIIEDEVPAAFIYSPDYTYLISNKINGYNFSGITNPSDRFQGIESWYIAKDYVWKIFAKEDSKKVTEVN